MKHSHNFFIILLIFILCNFMIIQAQPTFVYHICPNDTVFTRNSIYQTNLNLTLSSLSLNANRSNGFYNTSSGNGPTGDAFGLFLCRGDISAQVCRNCVTKAVQDIPQLCPVEVNAITWYDQCFLQYSNQSFFARLQTSRTVYMWNTQNISDPIDFNSLVLSLFTSMRDAAARAAIGTPGGKKFAVKEANFTAFQKVYTLVQCTPDLSSSDCSLCLETAISQLPRCCSGKHGGRVLTPSCNIRYEIYPFYNASAIEVPSPPPSSTGILPPPPSIAVAGSNGGFSITIIIAIGVPLSVSVLLFCLCCIFLRRRANKKHNFIPGDSMAVINEITTLASLQVDLNIIQVATNNFSEDNKLGEGGFGEVYKGTLPNGQKIAVKKLSRGSTQGSKEFKNEVLLLAKLQHRNLVRLLGFCLEGEEKILVYEYVPNKSLDIFLFNEEKRGQLDWSIRYKIVGGIARGILYLHEDSRLRIIHRDLKASNILLGGDMNAKISDFGMAKIFNVDQTQGNTSRIVGTFGYMSPEYAMHGQFSVKSDMYSFGVLALEIICGKKNSSFYHTNGAPDLVSYVWKHWREGTPMEVLDPILEDLHSRNEVLRCIQIGLLCVQEDPAERPTMATVVLMLDSYSVTLPMPQQPAFVYHTNSGLSMASKGLELDSYSTNLISVLVSVDETSITHVYPR